MDSDGVQTERNTVPKLNIDMFDHAPKIGDKIKVMGKVESIDEDSGEVDVSYDDVAIIGKNQKTNESMKRNEEMQPNTQTLDEALSKTFSQTQ